MNPNWKQATYSLTNEELKATLNEWDGPEYEPRFPKLLRWCMGKGRPKYRWQIWLSIHWPKKLKPVERWNSTLLKAEISAAIDEAMILELMTKVKKDE